MNYTRRSVIIGQEIMVRIFFLDDLNLRQNVTELIEFRVVFVSLSLVESFGKRSSFRFKTSSTNPEHPYRSSNLSHCRLSPNTGLLTLEILIFLACVEDTGPSNFNKSFISSVASTLSCFITRLKSPFHER